MDRHLTFLRNQSKRLRDMPGPPSWAESNAQQMDAIGAILLEARREQQMTTVGGKRLDQEAVDAVPELAGKKALVLYFNSDADRDEFAVAVQKWKSSARTVRIP